MPELRLSLLGPPSIACDGVPLDLHRHKNVALLAYLAVGGANPGRQRHTREALVTLLWPELEPSRARAGLHRNLSALRKTLGGAVQARGRAADPWVVAEELLGTLEGIVARHFGATGVAQCLATGPLPPEVVAAAQARGRAADPWAVAEELLRALEW
jgi:hypothetical protein